MHGKKACATDAGTKCDREAHEGIDAEGSLEEVQACASTILHLALRQSFSPANPEPAAACVNQLEWQHDRGFPALRDLGCCSSGMAPLRPKKAKNKGDVTLGTETWRCLGLFFSKLSLYRLVQTRTSSTCICHPEPQCHGKGTTQL